MKLTTLCYIENDDAMLMLHRVKKKQDVNKGKWIGVGGKFEAGESPDDCLLREVKEETDSPLPVGVIVASSPLSITTTKPNTCISIPLTALREKSQKPVMKGCYAGYRRRRFTPSTSGKGIAFSYAYSPKNIHPSPLSWCTTTMICLKPFLTGKRFQPNRLPLPFSAKDYQIA